MAPAQALAVEGGASSAVMAELFLLVQNPRAGRSPGHRPGQTDGAGANFQEKAGNNCLIRETEPGKNPKGVREWE